MWDARRCGLVLAAALLVGCGQDKPAPEPARPAPAPEPAKPATEAVEAHTSLARAFHRSRCTLIGVLAPDDTWKATGFDGEADFRRAFEQATKDDPLKVRQLVADSYAQPCRLPLAASAGSQP